MGYDQSDSGLGWRVAASDMVDFWASRRGRMLGVVVKEGVYRRDCEISFGDRLHRSPSPAGSEVWVPSSGKLKIGDCAEGILGEGSQ